MSDSARFALHRPEFLTSLVRGEEKIAGLLNGSSFALGANQTLIEADTEHGFVYRLLEGWAKVAPRNASHCCCWTFVAA
jgi:hypothetical protein